MDAKLTRYSGSDEAVEAAIRKLVALRSEQLETTLLLHGRDAETLLVLSFGDEHEDSGMLEAHGLIEVESEVLDVISPETERASLRTACDVLLRALAERPTAETRGLVEELEALSSKLSGDGALESGP